MTENLDSMFHSLAADFDFWPSRTNPRTSVKTLHDLSVVFPDSDSGFGSYKSKSHQMDDFSSSMSHLPRSHSLIRLNGLTREDLTEALQETTARHIHTKFENSEKRRTVLMHKLKEAQATLELQSERLSRIEHSAKDNAALVEDLKFKEREYRKKINQLQRIEKDKQILQLENARLREEMQNRIDSLDFQLRTLKNQHQTSENENDHRISLLDQTTNALSLLEEENTKLQLDRDKLREEIRLMRETVLVSKTRHESLEGDNRLQKTEAERLREENLSLNKQIHEMAGQMMELRNLLQAVKSDNERLSTSWQSFSEEKYRKARQMEGYQDTVANLKSKLAAAVADKDRLFQERLDQSHKVHILTLEKERLLKSQMVLEEQIGDQEKAVEKYQYSAVLQNSANLQLDGELSVVKLISSELDYKSQELKESEHKVKELQEAYKQLKNSNEIMSSKLQIVEQENLTLKQAINEGASEEEVIRLQEENKQLLDELENTQKENQNNVSECGVEKAASDKEFQKMGKERDALQKQVQLLNGQLNLLEGSKKHSDQTAQGKEEDLIRLYSELEISHKECAEAKRIAAQVKNLSEQLQKAKDQQEAQEKLIHTMKETAFVIIKQKGDLQSSEIAHGKKDIRLEQDAIVVVMDQAIYCKAQHKHWHDEKLQKCLVLRLGEFHTAMAFLTTIYKRFQDAGLRNIIIESGIIGEGSLGGILSAHDYSHSIQTIKMMFEGAHNSKGRQSAGLRLHHLLLTTYFNSLDTSEKQELKKQVKVLQDAFCINSSESFTRTVLHADFLQLLSKELMKGVGEELHQLSEEVKQLTEDIRGKEQIINDLKKELRDERNMTEAKEHVVADLKRQVSDLEQQNAMLTASHEAKPPGFSEDEQPSDKTKIGERSLREELEEAVRNKCESEPRKFRPASGLFVSKSLGHTIPANTGRITGNAGVHHGRYGSMFFHKPDKPGADSGNRLQTLISKYRSHSSEPSVNVMSSVFGGAKARSGSAPPAVKGLCFTPVVPKTPLLHSSSTCFSERSGDMSTFSTKEKIPPPTPPKPHKFHLKTISVTDEEAEEGEQPSGMLDTQEQSDINTLIQKYLKVLEM